MSGAMTLTTPEAKQEFWLHPAPEPAPSPTITARDYRLEAFNVLRDADRAITCAKVAAFSGKPASSEDLENMVSRLEELAVSIECDPAGRDAPVATTLRHYASCVRSMPPPIA